MRTPAPGLASPTPNICAGTGLTPRRHLRRHWAAARRSQASYNCGAAAVRRRYQRFLRSLFTAADLDGNHVLALDEFGCIAEQLIDDIKPQRIAALYRQGIVWQSQNMEIGTEMEAADGAEEPEGLTMAAFIEIIQEDAMAQRRLAANVSLTCVHTRTNTHACTHARTHARTHAHTHTRAHARAQRQTHAHAARRRLAANVSHTALLAWGWAGHGWAGLGRLSLRLRDARHAHYNVGEWAFPGCCEGARQRGEGVRPDRAEGRRARADGEAAARVSRGRESVR